MANPTPRNAVEALTRAARAALQCVARAEVLGSSSAPGLPGNLLVVPFGNMPANTLLLRRPDLTPYLRLEVATEYRVVQNRDASPQQLYQAIVTMYMYAIEDVDGRELIVYHWHPNGLSPVHAPHMHVSSAEAVALPIRPSSPEAPELVLSRIHFPTFHMELADLVRFLITELGVGSRRDDWESVLDRIEQ